MSETTETTQAAAEAKPTEKKPRKPRTSVYYSHLALMYCSPKGIEAVREAHAKEPVSRITARETIKQLDLLGIDTTQFAAWINETFGQARAHLKPGEKRPLTVQQGKRGGPYVRLSLDATVWKKGSTIYEERDVDGRYVLG